MIKITYTRISIPDRDFQYTYIADSPGAMPLRNQGLADKNVLYRIGINS
jgi:hypothetical protein